jgi:hypothetical protein
MSSPHTVPYRYPRTFLALFIDATDGLGSLFGLALATTVAFGTASGIAAAGERLNDSNS